MAEIAREIYVEEVMTRSPVTCSANISAKEAAIMMSEHDVGSLVVMDQQEPVGMLTEKDLVNKIVAKDLLPSKVKVEKVMTGPLITSSPGTTLQAAAERMSAMKLRRLPVLEDGKLVGILTENDMIRISPSLIQITREWDRINNYQGQATEEEGYLSGYCESCGSYSDMLRQREGRLLCQDCMEMGL